MNILVTGATGYIGKRIIPVLINKGHSVICTVRDINRFDASQYNQDKIEVIEVDFLDESTLQKIPQEIDAAYYLVHSMSSSIASFDELEKISAVNFRNRIEQTNIKQVIYLSGIVNNISLSKHLSSRKAVEDILAEGSYHLTTLRAGIIVGSGSASFEIIRDLVEKLPFMITPMWLNTRTQPVAIRNVVQFMNGVLLNKETFNKSYDIGGPEVLTYRDMLLTFARVRNLKRYIYVVPVMTPKLSSYWLYFITSTSYKLAINLVNSMKVEVICEPNNLASMLGIELISYEKAVRLAFDKIQQNEVLSSWTDALSGRKLEKGISRLVNIPSFGCLTDIKRRTVNNDKAVLKKIWSIGGQTGWYCCNKLWELRGLLDKMAGGVGLRRGRKSDTKISAGEALDFWRVIYASKKNRRLILYAEMKLPGEAWLEFRIVNNELIQTATFRPRGLWGRTYWYILVPFHFFIFRGMINNIAKG